MFDEIAQKLIAPGAVGVLPTDTVYGLVARASDPAAVARLYELKRREGKPGTLIAASIDQLVELGLKARYLKAVEQFWPGAVSVIIPCGPELGYLHEGKFSLAVRIPDQPLLTDLLQRTGPLLTSSANYPGEPVAINLRQAQAYFDDDVDFYVDGGDMSDHKPSTIIRVVDDAIEVLRQGSVIIKENE
jgi:L-threonylcarbamoyladenylate synthase